MLKIEDLVKNKIAFFIYCHTKQQYRKLMIKLNSIGFTWATGNRTIDIKLKPTFDYGVPIYILIRQDWDVIIYFKENNILTFENSGNITYDINDFELTKGIK